MTLEELNSVLKIVNNDLREYITTDDSATNDAIANGFFTVKDILDKGVLNIDSEPGAVVRIGARQEISREHFMQHYFPEADAMGWCKQHIAQSIARDPEFMNNIRFTTEDDHTKGCTVVQGEVLIAKHL